MAQKKKNLYVHDLYQFVDEWKRVELELGKQSRLPKLRIGVTELMHVFYRARRPWLQRCYFSRYEVVSASRSRTVKMHLCRLMHFFLNRSMVYVDGEGVRQDIAVEGEFLDRVDRYELWRNPYKKSNLYKNFRARKLRPGVFVPREMKT